MENDACLLILTENFPILVTRASRAAGTNDPPASEPRKTRQSVDKEVLSQSMTVTSSPRRPIRASRRLSTDTHEETPPVIRSLRNRRVSVDRESATGTPKLPEDSSENGNIGEFLSKPSFY